MPALVGAVRTILTAATILLSLLYGLVLLGVTRDRRRAGNGMIELWAVLGSAAAGMRLEVENAEFIEDARPAVFIFNHRTAADILIICMLLRRDFTGVAKQEIRRNPILGPAFAFAGAVFIDRFHHEAAVQALQPAVDTLRSGISIGIAPEGTRSPDRRVGPFKKGAFRLAMAAQVPIVPIVIHNADDVLPRKALTLRAATVRVTVCPPITTSQWTRETLDAEIAEAHRLFRETLCAS